MTGLCLKALSTKEIGRALHLSPYTVQDHLKVIFEKTGARSRAELVGWIFLDRYVPQWVDVEDAPPGWVAKASLTPG